MDLNRLADQILARKRCKEDEIQNIIHPDIMLRYNSITVVVGKRGAGKTYWLCRELIKLIYAPDNKFTQVYYVSSKEHDDTFAYVQQCLKDEIEIVWVKTDDALKVINALTKAKAELGSDNDDDMYREALNATRLARGVCPHTLIIYDDCIGTFKNDNVLTKPLFQNRQAHISYVLILQDIGLATSIKSNLDMLVLFGGFSRQKYSVLTYQLPPVDGFDFELYSTLGKNDYVAIDYNDSSIIVKYRD